MRIEAIRLKNFKALQDVNIPDVCSYSVFVGANGTGKTTLFSVFGFLRDCLKDNVRSALAKHGGFKEVVSRGHDSETILIELKIRMGLSIGERTVTYVLEIGLRDGTPVVAKENLRYTRYGGGQPFNFIQFVHGVGTAIRNEGELTTKTASEEREEQKLESPDILAIKGLGQFQRFEAASAFRSLIENWHVSDFHINAARTIQDAGFAEHLSQDGENLALVAQFLYENHRSKFDQILKGMERRVPGIQDVKAEQTPDGRVILRFQDGSFKDPFIARYVSDGTIKMFAYLTLLHDPKPHPLLCVEEPENQLYPTLLPALSEEFSEYARKGGGQVFVATHSPDYLNHVDINNIFVLTKQSGYTRIRKAVDFPQIKELFDAGDRPGELWRQGMFQGVDP